MTEHASAGPIAFGKEFRLSRGELWLRYFELDGMSTRRELEAFLCGALPPSTHDRDLIAYPINERFVELGGNQSVAYSNDPDPDLEGQMDMRR